MTRNMGALDRGLRTFILVPAATAAAIVLGAGTPGGVVLLVVAGIMLATSGSAFCPTYSLLGISTRDWALPALGRRPRGGHV